MREILHKLSTLILALGLLTVMQPLISSSILLKPESLSVDKDLNVYFLRSVSPFKAIKVRAEWAQEIQTVEGLLISNCTFAGLSEYESRDGVPVVFSLGCTLPEPGVYVFKACWRVRGFLSIPLRPVCLSDLFTYREAENG